MKVKSETKKETSYRHTWWGKAVVTSLTAWMFASTVAVILVILHTIDFRPIKHLEQFGIDRSMRLYSDTASVSMPYKYAFIDVDKEACKQFLDDNTDWDPECRTSKPVPASLIIDFVRAAKESQAALVIIDVSPPEKNEPLDREVLARKLAVSSEHSDTWIISPVYARPSDSLNGLTIDGDTRFDIVPSHTRGRLRLASAATFADHGVIRAYPTASCYVTADGQRWIPTIPYLAALLIKNPLMEQYYYDSIETSRAVATNVLQSCSKLKISSDSLVNEIRFDLPLFDPLDTDQIPAIIHFFYSLPSLGALADVHERESVSWNHIYNYQYYEASKLISYDCLHQHIDGSSASPGCFITNEEYYKGKIIVLGSSRAQAMDQMQTPIGSMSGSELILNATRAFLEFKPLGQSPPLTMLMDKLKGIGIAMGPMFIAWCLIFLSGPITRQVRWNLLIRCRRSELKILRQCHWQVFYWLRSLFVVFIFISGIYVAYILEVVYLLNQLKQGIATDLLLPAFALGLQGFAVAAKLASAAFYTMAEAFLGFLLNRTKSFFH
ncbi:CHASE2 domain-containing protein [Nitrosomonas sp. Is35]|uniref:CHASE2 domain-containing protein n=1 Tax=Nitrosomonas sp. Is35 TaxID=3080534 RepID=UPI00294B480E|nr:CHASE2 domain-containing protein [Nitrosomonas sp. Is35]MDV6348657.1 CHASE2 domain-containing protein [Nitrosomonas sp. Is35]